MKYKEIPGSNGVMINLNKQLQMKDGSECTLTVEGNHLTLEMFGDVMTLDISWAAFTAHYEISTKEEQDVAYFGQYLVNRIKNNASTWVNYKKPIYVKDRYRVIPAFSRYAVSEDGVVINRSTLEVLKVRRSTQVTNVYGKVVQSYPTVDVYCPDKSRNRQVKLHRLVAMAWVPNSDPHNFTIVDHKDTDRTNYHRKNLEWVDDAENLRRASYAGAFDNKPCLLRDVLEDTVTSFPSSKFAFKSIGLARQTITSDMWLYRPPLFKGRYEIKLEEDPRDWVYTKENLPTKNARYTITVTKPDGTVEVTEGVTDFRIKYKLWNLPDPVPGLVSILRQREPSWVITYIDRKNNTPVQALHVETQTVYESDTIRGLIRITGHTKTEARLAIMAEKKYLIKGYIYRRKSDDPWPTDCTEKKSQFSKCILATELSTGKDYQISGTRKAAKLTGVTRASINQSVREGRPISGWSFRLI